MSKEEPILIVSQRPKILCPVCGTPTYSAGGIHPQCAVNQADDSRMARLKLQRAEAPKEKKPTRNVWKKRCPKCGNEAHVRLGVCKCGHSFSRK
jgi:predicted RNA-binding Zn-ribbon protein involved in translation (DUF1610 family)